MTTTNNRVSSFEVRAVRATVFVLVGVALGASVATLNHDVRANSSATAPSPVPASVPPVELPGVLPPCVYEDSSDCYWLAPTSGNGSGRSFIDIGGQVIYLDGVDIQLPTR